MRECNGSQEPFSIIVEFYSVFFLPPHVFPLQNLYPELQEGYVSGPSESHSPRSRVSVGWRWRSAKVS